MDLNQNKNGTDQNLESFSRSNSDGDELRYAAQRVTSNGGKAAMGRAIVGGERALTLILRNRIVDPCRANVEIAQVYGKYPRWKLEFTQLIHLILIENVPILLLYTSSLLHFASELYL